MTSFVPALSLFAWGALGGMTMASTMFLLPGIARIAVTGTVESDHRLRAAGSTAAVLLLGAIAGVLALTLPDTAGRGQAIFTGITALGTIKGIATAGREAIPVLLLEQS